VPVPAIAFSLTPLVAAPSVTAVSPPPHAITIPATADILIDFNTALNPATVVPSNIKAWGHWSGMMTGQLQLENGNTRVRYVPARPFSAGELVTIFVAQNIQDSNGDPMLRGYSWTYWIWSSSAGMELQEVQRIPRQFETTRLRAFQIMPNHVHGIVEIDSTAQTGLMNQTRTSINRHTGRGLINLFLHDSLTKNWEAVGIGKKGYTNRTVSANVGVDWMGPAGMRAELRCYMVHDERGVLTRVPDRPLSSDHQERGASSRADSSFFPPCGRFSHLSPILQSKAMLLLK
jgi:hypothetical protein